MSSRAGYDQFMWWETLKAQFPFIMSSRAMTNLCDGRLLSVVSIRLHQLQLLSSALETRPVTINRCPASLQSFWNVLPCVAGLSNRHCGHAYFRFVMGTRKLFFCDCVLAVLLCDKWALYASYTLFVFYLNHHTVTDAWNKKSVYVLCC